MVFCLINLRTINVIAAFDFKVKFFSSRYEDLSIVMATDRGQQNRPFWALILKSLLRFNYKETVTLPGNEYFT